MKDPFTGQMLQRAAEKVKTFGGSEEYVVEPQDTGFQKLGAYAEAARGLGAHLRLIGP